MSQQNIRNINIGFVFKSKVTLCLFFNFRIVINFIPNQGVGTACYVYDVIRSEITLIGEDDEFD